MPALDTYPRSFGKYVLLRPLAAGGMAEVFLAQMRGPAGFDKACVVKRVLPGHVANSQYMEMFLDEARVIARLSHPNVVQVFDMGELESDYFMAMEYVPGADLQNLLDALPENERRVPVPVACRIIAQVAEGLDHAHRAVDGAGLPLGIVHRDVSPSNVIISVDGVAKICDFGIAKSGAQASKTEIGSLKGKIHYMSPEQVRGDRVDARSDLFSLGAVLYEMTIGVRPFEGNGPADIAIKILNDEPQPPELYVDNFPRELWAVVQCLLSKRPTDRFASGRELQVALDELLLAWSARASSNEVAAYLEQAMPGIGERALATSALAARSSSTEMPGRPSTPTAVAAMAVGPTSELRAFGAGAADLAFGEESAAPVPVSLDLSGPSLSGESSPPPRRSSSMGAAVIVLIAIAVAVGFWWITRQPAVAPTAPPIAPPAPSGPKAPGPAPSPSPPPVDVAPTPVVTPLPIPVGTAPQPKVEKPRPRPKPRDDGPHELPRLPTPPPVDDAE